MVITSTLTSYDKQQFVFFFFFSLMLNQKYMSSFILFNLGTIGLFIYSTIWTKFNVFQLYRQCFYFHWNLIFFFLWFTKRIKTDFFSVSCRSNKEYCKTILRNAYPVKYNFEGVYLSSYIYTHICIQMCVYVRERKGNREKVR